MFTPSATSSTDTAPYEHLAMSGVIEARLTELGIVLPPASSGGANRVPVVHSGLLLFLSGHGPVTADGRISAGKLGRDLTADEGYAAARLTGLGLLATIRAAAGSLDRVARIVKVLGLVNCANGFNATPRVIDGCSDLFVEVFGPDVGRHARSAIGVAELPSDFALEIEMVVELDGLPPKDGPNRGAGNVSDR